VINDVVSACKAISFIHNAESALALYVVLEGLHKRCRWPTTQGRGNIPSLWLVTRGPHS